MLFQAQVNNTSNTPCLFYAGLQLMDEMHTIANRLGGMSILLAGVGWSWLGGGAKFVRFGYLE